MKLFIYSLITVITLALVAAIWLKTTNKEKNVLREAPALTLTDEMGEIIHFDKSNYNDRLVFNFYSSSCEFCNSEIEEIITFSRKSGIPIIFATSDSAEDMQRFISECRKNIVKEGDKISFVHISFEESRKLFEESTVPQTVSFDPGLKIRRIKKGIVTSLFLQETFE